MKGAGTGQGAHQKAQEALSRLLGRQEFDSITVTDIAFACGFSRQYFYRNFSDKYALIADIFEEDLRVGMEEAFFSMRTGAAKLLEALLRHIRIYRSIVLSRDYAWLYRLFFDYGIVIARAIAEYSVYRVFSAEQEQALRFFLSGVVSTLFARFTDGHRETAESLAKLFCVNLPASLQYLLEEEVTTDYILYKIKKFRQNGGF